MLTWSNEQIKAIQDHARNIRMNIIKMLSTAKSGHTAGSLSVVDIIACLYFAILKQADDPTDKTSGDHLILSNGHVCPALYATMAEAGLITTAELSTLRKFNSRLQGHPERTKLSLLETTSGPLGEGLSQAAGMAYALKYLSSPNNTRVFCIMSDGELNEGNVWEAAMFASKYRLDNLIVIVDTNGIQLSGQTSKIMPLPKKTACFTNLRWNVYREFHGNDIAHLLKTLAEAMETPNSHLMKPDAPKIIFIKTVPGCGVSFMENDYKWHGKVPTSEEATRALKELAEVK